VGIMCGHHHHVMDFKRRFTLSAFLTIPLLFLSESIYGFFGMELSIPYGAFFSLLLSTVIFFYGGLPFLSGLVYEVRARRPGMMTLVGFAITIAFAYSAVTVFSGEGFFLELATLIDVMLLGHWIEARSVMGASIALEGLAKLMPKHAHLIVNGDVRDVSVSDLRVGDIVLVKPGEKIPCDGVVVEGETHVDEALLTGESKPVYKGVGDRVIGGSINGDGILKVRVDRSGDETYLAQVIRLVKQAQMSKTRIQDIADKAAALLFYISLAAGVITFLYWYPVSGVYAAISRTVTVLVIACPHALGLAIPLVVALTTSITAKMGILIRDRMALELVRDIDTVVFDKTGTLTLGVLKVTKVIPYIDLDELVSLTASLELNSEHTIARAIVEYAKSIGIGLRKVEEFKSMPGRGVYGRIDGKKVYVGGWNLLKELKIPIKDDVVRELGGRGETLVFTVVDGTLAGVFALSDVIRPESYEAVKALKDMGINVYMITGDSEDVARWVAEEINIDRYFANVLPHEKAEKIKDLMRMGYRVAMVGDGVNDAPALVSAHVGIAIGAGTDVAIENASIILVGNDPRGVVKVLEIARKSYSKMIQNLWWAAGYNAIAIPMAAGVTSNLGLIIPPAIGAIIMSISDVIVALNSSTLKRYEPKIPEYMEKYILIDPVCGMEVDPNQAYGKIEYKGITIYFCSKECQEKFKRNPERYFSKLLKGGG